MKILILFGHPAYHKSTINKGLLKGLKLLDKVTLHNLYDEYPEMDIDIDREQELLTKHDCIIFMFPLFWYSTPAIFKEWQDMVLEHDWAYGSKGNALEGKLFFCAVSSGATRLMYKKGHLQNYSLGEFLSPLTQMARHCKMIPLPPFATHGAYIMEDQDLEEYKTSFHTLLSSISKNKLDIDEALKLDYLNDVILTEG